MVFLVGGPGIAAAVFSLGHFLRGSVSSFFGLQFGGAMGAGAENT